MKFAKELDQEAVPEWRIKYLNYKAGKKYVKAVSRALGRANSATPGSAGLHRTPTFFSPSSPPTHETYQPPSQTVCNKDGTTPSIPPPGTASSKTTTEPIPTSSGREREALRKSGDNLQYGSFVVTPPDQSPEHAPLPTPDAHHDFELPAPAMKVPSAHSAHHHPPPRPVDSMRRQLSRLALQRSTSLTAPPHSPTENTNSQGPAKLKHASTFQDSPSQLRRLFTHTSTMRGLDRSRTEIGLHTFDPVREREREFFDFLDTELDKVESFYKMKEEQAGERLNILRIQLHEMRNRRLQELAEDQYQNNKSDDGHHENNQDKANGWVQPIKAKIFPPGPNSKALQKMNRTPVINPRTQGDASKDYIRRPQEHEVSYRTAKRKLKLALQEFYRGLELLKSYAMVNRTAFRKLNKKYDKAVNARPPYRYLNEKVNKSWFVNSDVLEGHIRSVEDLYARYFERGNHKLAAGKLRSLTKKPLDQSGSTFQNGFLIGTGAVFTIQGVIFGAQLLYDDDEEVRRQTSYVLQIYGGYFLMLTLFSLFCIDCSLWTKNKVNYPFIFEFDQRHRLDWRELAQFPSFFFLVLGVFMWVNFSRYGIPEMYIYYPVILIFVTILVLFLPAPILWHRSRRWFVYSHWRLLLAGLYPVEFRDFFLGDIYCSLTYATANIELFFCLYAHGWENPVQCNSNHSRLLGFFTALPPIWRFLQCLRRYRDTRNVFPHLVNGGKYTMTIVAAVMLSLYRIHDSRTNLALFITFSIVNSIYCSIWDLFMDFSLIQTNSRHFLLRDILALKSRWPYYFIIIIDPILRFAWIFYAIFTHNSQHSTIVSFMVSFAEVLRRGMWALFRVENEHCGNVSQYKASRDVPLPYRIEPLMDRASISERPATHDEAEATADVDRRATASSTAISTAEEGPVRRRADTVSSRRNFTRILAEAHKQDFEKKRRPADQVVEEETARQGISDDDDDEGDEEVGFIGSDVSDDRT